MAKKMANGRNIGKTRRCSYFSPMFLPYFSGFGGLSILCWPTRSQAYDLHTAPKNFTQISRLLSHKNDTPVFSCSPWSGLSCHGLFLFFMGRSKPHGESWPGAQQSYNITSTETKKNVLERKMPQGIVLVKSLLARQSKGQR